ncbi:helix-turn-helix domain-containing protein [Acidomonas methanolica]|uniref:Transcriptional regulator XRE n=1 Tax=Acidomonas methanolica NBRC 104435 TaxID=1231351 RepID=A0A023D4Y2_ACIMT|nr:helix-turn-helix transcriptional regulator [Acidomonas methanolica]MBU2653103.1 helix-turn-helix domain-containing protein [Acidomonas methanolica]TCS27219.1 Xre family transcriptional regulator [Acidomonas methanolica]GAJ29129.1 transcriptional regulator XRE [Acidomonas methanolica NBRC 104435]GBQ47058.1 transposase [Acidomonas methanolica]GEL00414.1 transcriptional regulator [Acidomonas methanolica NBRC 104435]
MQKSLRTPRQQLLISLLVEARRARGMTQAEVALALGKPQSFVAKYENGERRIDVIEFMDIVAALDISPAAILARIEAARDSATD